MPSEVPAAVGADRLHPASLLFSIGSAAWRLLLPGLAVLVFSRGRGYELWLLILFVPAVAAALMKYLSFRYRLGDDELVVREGIVTRNERHIPYSRVQNIDLVRNPLHRMLGVAEVRLETAGGEKPEAVMRVLSLADVERMRARVFAGRRERDAAARPAGDASRDVEPPDTARAVVVHRMTAGDILRFGIISNQGMVVVAALMGLLWQADLMDYEEFGKRMLPTLPQRLPEVGLGGGLLRTSMLVLAGLVGFLVLLRVFSVAWSFVQFHDFRLQRQQDDLRVDYGLFTRISKTIPRRKIQIVAVRQSFLHRLFRRASIQIETAGSSDDESETANRLWLTPLAAEAQVGRLVGEALPGMQLDDVEWRPLAPRALRRMLRKTAFVLVVLGALGAAVAGAWGVVPSLALAPLGYAYCRLYVRHTGWAVAHGAVLYRSGWWVRRVSAARFGKIQALQLGESPFDRRNRMASLKVDTAGGGRIAHAIDMAMLDAADAVGLRDRLSREAHQTAFRW